jgi:DNA-binding response OmpR family regulator
MTMKILFAEDDEGSRHIMIAQLRKLGHEVVPVVDGNEAWVIYQQIHPDLVITDWNMPGLNGLELCRRIRSEKKRNQYAYIIILTAMDRKQGFVEGMEAGADDFMTKPCDFAELVVRLRVAQRIVALQTHVASLQGLLPICPDCKKIRDEKNEWQPVEAYIAVRSEATFSHGICPECMESIIKPQMMEMRRKVS